MSVKRGGRDNDVPYFTGTASGQPDGQLLLRYASFCSGNVRYANENSFPLPGSFGISLRVVRGVSGAVKDSFILLLLFAFYLTVLRPIASLKGGTMKCTYQFEGSWKPPLFMMMTRCCPRNRALRQSEKIGQVPDRSSAPQRRTLVDHEYGHKRRRKTHSATT